MGFKRLLFAACIGLLLVGCADQGGYSSNPGPSPAAVPSGCLPAPCLSDKDGMQVFVVKVVRQPQLLKPLKPGYFPIEVFLRWRYSGTGSSRPLSGEIYAIGPDKIFGERLQDSDGSILPDCMLFDAPELASGGEFGPKALCFYFRMAPTGALTLRWKHGLFGGPDQDLILE